VNEADSANIVSGNLAEPLQLDRGDPLVTLLRELKCQWKQDKIVSPN